MKQLISNFSGDLDNLVDQMVAAIDMETVPDEDVLSMY